jgi:RNA polymerase sigma-70 factor (sigma-E family)
VADDIISFGRPVPGDGRRRDADEAIESLFHACYPHLVRTGYALTADWDLAEQLAQEAYLRLWRRWRWLADPQAAPAYLQRTVVNLSRETIRRRVIERRALGRRRADERVVMPPDSAAAVALRKAMAGLPARKRECVALRYLLGLSEAETADALGISVGTVKSQTYKGLRMLRDQLADPADPDPAVTGAADSGPPSAGLGGVADAGSEGAGLADAAGVGRGGAGGVGIGEVGADEAGHVAGAARAAEGNAR